MPARPVEAADGNVREHILRNTGRIYPCQDDGKCMGASAHWCENAIKTSNYKFNPHTPGQILQKTESLTKWFCEETNKGGKLVLVLRQLLHRVGIAAYQPPETLGSFRYVDVIGAMKRTPDIYLVGGGTHVMAASTKKNPYCWFLDNENGIYRCRDLDSWEQQIQENRHDAYVYSVEKGWHHWLCVKCTLRPPKSTFMRT